MCSLPQSPPHAVIGRDGVLPSLVVVWTLQEVKEKSVKVEGARHKYNEAVTQLHSFRQLLGPENPTTVNAEQVGRRESELYRTCGVGGGGDGVTARNKARPTRCGVVFAGAVKTEGTALVVAWVGRLCQNCLASWRNRRRRTVLQWQQQRRWRRPSPL